MSRTTLSRKELIAYIKKNKPFYSGASFEGHSLAQLVIMKTDIEVNARKSNAAPNE